MKKDYLDYIQETFSFSETEISDFECHLNLPLKKSIRVNTNKIQVDDFKQLAKENKWKLESTALGKNTFYIDREDTEIALGNTPEHQSGLFYIQEVSASSSPYYLSGDKVDRANHLILDMSASPGGKTTSLSEYYPNSLIVANELDKTRLKGLFSNLDRMGAMNVVVSNYDGRFFKRTPEMFDKILLDAPCSGEGTGFKTDDALKYWNIKNIKRIAKLQFGLFESAIKSAKVGGEIIYSTCTLNTIENEGVIEKALKKYEGILEVHDINSEHKFKRSWPHIDKAGGFFVAKFKKIKSLENEKSVERISKQGIDKLKSKEETLIKKVIQDNYRLDLSDKHFYKYLGEVYMTNKNLDLIFDYLFLYQIGIKIGRLKDSEFKDYENLEGIR